MSTNGDWVPDWAKEIVWYQIFPERFRNGNSKNDPTLEDLRGAHPHDLTQPWQIHPWISDWYELQPYEKANGKGLGFNILRRRYGGDLEGILEKLDYLHDLGIGGIYLNPVFQAPSHHKYDGATYHHIDPNFGPDPVGDKQLMAQEEPGEPSTWVWTSADKLMLQLIQEVHRRDMKIIFDGVFNHMGITSWAFQDVKNKQANSKYRDWFHIYSWNDAKRGTKFRYKSWWGVPELPELRQDEEGIVDRPKQYIFAATRRWMDPNADGNPEDGIDGWRLDVAFCIRHNFWKDWRKLVKSINPEAYLTAEVIDEIDVLKTYLRGDEFDAVMNYNFAFTCSEYFVDEKMGISTSEFDRKLRELRDAFAPCVAYVMQNLLDSHDTSRIGTQIVNRDKLKYRDWMTYIKKSKATNPDYHTRKPTDKELRVQKLLAIFQMTYVGAPMIYYGDEAGMWGANDPDCRKPMLWKELNYDSEAFLPDGTLKPVPDRVAFNRDLFDHYKRLIHIRNTTPALQSGDFRSLLTDDEKRIYAFQRCYRKQNVVVVINNSRDSQHIQLGFLDTSRFEDVLNERSVDVSDGKLNLTLQPKWASILVNGKMSP